MNVQKNRFSFIFSSSFLLFVFKPRATGILCFFSWFIYASGKTKVTGLTECWVFRSCAVRFGAVFPSGNSGSHSRAIRTIRITSELQGGKTFRASFCASLIAGSRRAFLCDDWPCWLYLFVKCTRCERLLFVEVCETVLFVFFLCCSCSSQASASRKLKNA